MRTCFMTYMTVKQESSSPTFLDLIQHTNQMSLLHGKHLPLLAVKYNRKTVTVEVYTEGVTRWLTAVLKSDNHLMMPFFIKNHIAQIKLHENYILFQHPSSQNFKMLSKSRI